jgi:hypothetical protein
MPELKRVEEINTEPGEDTIVVHPRPGVKVYDNPHGMIVIRNFGDPYDDDSFTIVHPDDAQSVANALLEIAAILKQS